MTQKELWARDAADPSQVACRSMGPPEGVLCLPGPAFSYDYATGGLEVQGMPLTVHQDGGQGRGTAWCVWDASVVLALFLASPAFDSLLSSLPATKQSQSLRCVELGSGTGLGGLALAARLREAASVEVVLTDLSEALPALQRNVDANPTLRGLITVAPCDWLTPPAGLTGDIVVAADCVWLSDLVTPFVNTLAQTLRHDGIALLVHQTRSVSVDDRLWAGLAKAGFIADRQPQPPGAESAAACVYILRRQARE